jgi:hypothetical protein
MIKLAKLGNLRGVFIADIWNPNRWYYDTATNLMLYLGVHAVSRKMIKGEENGFVRLWRMEYLKLPTGNYDCMYMMAILFILALYLDLLKPETYMDDDYKDWPGPINYLYQSQKLEREPDIEKAMFTTVSNFSSKKEGWSFNNAKLANGHLFKLS